MEVTRLAAMVYEPSSKVDRFEVEEIIDERENEKLRGTDGNESS